MDGWVSRGDSTDGPGRSADDGRVQTFASAVGGGGCSALTRSNRDGRDVSSSPDRDVAMSALLLFSVRSLEELQLVADHQCLLILVLYFKVLGYHAVVV